MSPTEEQLQQTELFPERAQEKRIDELERENRELRAQLKATCKPKKEQKKSELTARDLKKMVDDQRQVISDQANKLREPADVRPLCEAIEILMAAVKMTLPENYRRDHLHMLSVEEYREGHRQFLVDAVNAAERLYRDNFSGVPCLPEWLFGNPDLPRLWRDFKSQTK